MIIMVEPQIMVRETVNLPFQQHQNYLLRQPYSDTAAEQ